VSLLSNDPHLKPLGPLEWRVLEALWAREGVLSVRDLQPEFPDIAYTTLMTTLDRLHRKRLLERVKQGRAFFYSPRFSRAQYDSARAAAALRTALSADETSLTPLLSFFVEAVSERNDGLLDTLDSLVRARRDELDRERS
jgi:predicted transcriptional regulator